jgi:hypothetical protein
VERDFYGITVVNLTSILQAEWNWNASSVELAKSGAYILLPRFADLANAWHRRVGQHVDDTRHFLKHLLH